MRLSLSLSAVLTSSTRPKRAMPVGFQLCPSLAMRDRRRRGGRGGGGGAGGEEPPPSAVPDDTRRELRRRVAAAPEGEAARCSRGAAVGEVGAPICAGLPLPLHCAKGEGEKRVVR